MISGHNYISLFFFFSDAKTGDSKVKVNVTTPDTSRRTSDEDTRGSGWRRTKSVLK